MSKVFPHIKRKQKRLVLPSETPEYRAEMERAAAASKARLDALLAQQVKLPKTPRVPRVKPPSPPPRVPLSDDDLILMAAGIIHSDHKIMNIARQRTNMKKPMQECFDKMILRASTTLRHKTGLRDEARLMFIVTSAIEMELDVITKRKKYVNEMDALRGQHGEKEQSG